MLPVRSTILFRVITCFAPKIGQAMEIRGLK